MMITASPSASSQTETRDSSHVPALGNSLLPSVSPVSVPPPAFLAEAFMIRLGIEERIGRIEATQKELEVNLKVSKEWWPRMRYENEVPYKQNEELAWRLRAKLMKNDELSIKVRTLHAELKKVTKEHKMDISRINADYENAMATLKCNQEEAFEGFKKNILKMLSNVTVELKSNIFLYTQVVIGPFYVHWTLMLLLR
ncbi:hypothetical protein PVK06_020543 [Gossypium arboreum]|uniref:Uncharacterized protein n=1 Tax=Gossypium arboreum TaxID=29729 RepID=A0ABR0PN51_GOSAR|nr:hypothetical protein PVK06_020543 [Gossypium arboreum]